MCTEVEGIDVLITGHQHRSIAGELNGVTIIQYGCNGLSLGKISVIFQKKIHTGRFSVNMPSSLTLMRQQLQMK